MKPILATVLAAATTNFNARFQMGAQAAQPWGSQLAMDVPSETSEEVYHWLTELPTVREWVGEKKIHAVSANGYRLINKDWEQTIAVARNAVMDDRLGVYLPLFQQMGAALAKFPDQQLARLLRVGTSATNGLCWDGGAFFAASHTVDPNSGGTSPTYQNLYTSKALTNDNFESVFAAMSIFKGANGEVMDNVPDTLIVPPALRATALRIVGSEVQAVTQGSGAAAITNPNKGLVDVLVVPELSSAYSDGSDTTWYLAKTKGPIKPLVHQRRYDSGLIQRNKPDTDNVFLLQRYEYGVELRAAFGYSFPFLMARCEA